MNPFSKLDDNQARSIEGIDMIFSKQKLEHRYLHSKKSVVGKNNLSNIAVMNQVLLVSTTDGIAWRTNTDVLSDLDEIEVSRRGQEDSIEKIFLSPDGSYSIICLKSGENFFLQEKTLRPRRLSKLSGCIESVSFDNHRAGESIKTFLAGTSFGKIYEILIDTHGKEKACQLVYSHHEKKAIGSLFFQRIDGKLEKLFLSFVVSSPFRLYHIFGGPTLQQLLSDGFQSQTSLYTDLPSEKAQHIDVHYGLFSDERHLPFTILAKTGLYNGLFKFPAENVSGDLNVEISYLPTSAGVLSDPISSVATQYHILSLRKERVQAISTLSGELVEEIVLRKV